MRKLITNNIGWKLLSILLALLLWFVVVNIEDPYITKEINNVPVIFVNEEVITAQDKTVEMMSGGTVNVTVGGKRKEIDNLKAADLIAEADLRYISFTNAVTIKVTANRDSIDILKQSSDSVAVNVESIKYGQLSVEYNILGNPAENYVVDYENIKISPNMVEFSGPETQMVKVKKVVVDINVEGAKNNVILSTFPKLLDENGNEVTKVTSKTKEIQVEVGILRKKTVLVSLEKTGIVQTGYILTDFSYSPYSVTIYGKDSELANITKIQIEDYDISDVIGDYRDTIYISDYLPTNIKVETDKDEIVLNISVEKLIDKEVTVPISDISVTNIEANMQFEILTDTDIDFKIRGLESSLGMYEKYKINTQISLHSLGAGEHLVPVDLIVPEILAEEITVVGELPKVMVKIIRTAEEIEEPTVE